MYCSNAKEFNGGYITFFSDSNGYPPIISINAALGIGYRVYKDKDDGEDKCSYYVEIIPDKYYNKLLDVIDGAIANSKIPAEGWKRDDNTKINIKINCDFDKYNAIKVPYEEWVSGFKDHKNIAACEFTLHVASWDILQCMVTCVFMKPYENAVTISIKPTEKYLDRIYIYEPIYPGLDDDEEFYYED